MSRYWQRIVTSEETSLTYKALQVNIEMGRQGYRSYYTIIKCILAILKAKNIIYPIHKTQIKNKSMNLCEAYCTMHEKSFFQLLFEKTFYRKENYITQFINNKLHRHITGI